MRTLVLCPLLLFILPACEDNSTMRPGQDCLSCHHSGGEKAWTVAGTVFPDPNAGEGQGLSGATIALTDANQQTVTLESNSAGNFYTSRSLAFPVDVVVTRGTSSKKMVAAPNGACNSCHTSPPQQGAPGRVYVP